MNAETETMTADYRIAMDGIVWNAELLIRSAQWAETPDNERIRDTLARHAFAWSREIVAIRRATS